MESKVPNIIAFQQENEQWKTDIAFCRDEIKVLNRYLQEVIEKDISSEMKKEIAGFQHKLSEKRKLSCELLDTLKAHEELLGSEEDSISLAEKQSLVKQKVDKFCREYSALKSLFVRFLAKADLIV